MNVKKAVCYEPYALVHEVPYPGGDLRISWSELRAAKVGTVWSVEDQDKFPNRTATWTVEYRVVYKDNDGILIKRSSDGDETVELTWFELV